MEVTLPRIGRLTAQFATIEPTVARNKFLPCRSTPLGIRVCLSICLPSWFSVCTLTSLRRARFSPRFYRACLCRAPPSTNPEIIRSYLSRCSRVDWRRGATASPPVRRTNPGCRLLRNFPVASWFLRHEGKATRRTVFRNSFERKRTYTNEWIRVNSKGTRDKLFVFLSI